MARVLVIDDDPILVKVATACLQLDQHQVWAASDLASGVALLQREPVDLVLTDLFAQPFAPDAFTPLAALTQVTPTAPVVVATAHAQAAAFDPARYGLAAIVLKPYSPHDLRMLVAQVLAE